MTERDISASRTGRIARMGRVLGGEGARSIGVRAANLGRSEEDGQAALSRRRLEFADRLVTLLGDMRGAAMKVGQMLSVADFGLIPDGDRAAFQARLAALQDRAPNVPWRGMRGQLEAGLGARIGEVFAELDETPVAAASIGQVYRARLHDGRPVAVKVQYPGIASAVRSDIKNLRLLAPVARGLFAGLDLGSIVDEVELRVLEELDYEHEAANHRTLARAFDGHPFIRVPRVHSELCSDAVLVSDWLEGRPLASAYELGQEQRDVVAEILFRFYMGTPYLRRCFSGDPHPGNTLLLDDGTLGFIDFGLTKTISATAVERELAALRALTEGDAERLVATMRRQGLALDPARVSAAEVREALMISQGWYLRDADAGLTASTANEIAARATDPAGPVFRVFQGEPLPEEHMVQRRVEVLVLATLGQLQPRVNFHRIAREWIFDEPAQTELGRLERAWRDAGSLVPAGAE
jgi:predicted unusual protein kinase regulating ubiquinone biosynthesis (AarF/ABC1/UbiB family)